MKAKKITLFMLLTVISLLTIFLVLLLDDTVLAAENYRESGLKVHSVPVIILLVSKSRK